MRPGPAGAREGRHGGPDGKIEALRARAKHSTGIAAECLVAFVGREDDESEEADRALVGATLLAELLADVRAIRRYTGAAVGAREK